MGDTPHITAYPLLHAANKEIENGAILRPRVQPKLDIAHQSYQHFRDKRVWIERQLHEDGTYTTYSWAYDASKKLGDEWRTGSRPIIVAEGFAVKGDHPNLPITEELMEQIHQTSLPHLRAFFPLTLEQWDPRRKAGGHHTDLTFEIPASVPPGQTLVPEDAIGHLPTHDFIAEAKLVKELDARLAKPNAKQQGVAAPEPRLQSGSPSSGRPAAGASKLVGSISVKTVGMGCAVAAIAGLGYLWYRKSREREEAKGDSWTQRISRERQEGVALATR